MRGKASYFSFTTVEVERLWMLMGRQLLYYAFVFNLMLNIIEIPKYIMVALATKINNIKCW